MEIYDRIGLKHGIEVPDLYRVLSEKGLFSYYGEYSYEQLTSRKRLQILESRIASGELLYLAQVEWYSPEELLDFRPGTFAPGLLPIAGDGAGDQWCWYSPWAEGSELPVVLYDHEMWTVTGAAADYASWLYRMLLESLTSIDTSFGDPNQAGQHVARYISLLTPHFLEPWVQTLEEISRREVRKTSDDIYYLLPEDECRTLIEQQLAFPYLATTIKVRPGGKGG